VKGLIMAKKLPKAELEKLPGCAAEFIRLVIKKMRYRKKVRADVMTELIAHFEDGLNGYATGEEKERKAQELVAEFGDAKLLGVLLRRAKKRCRPLWRTVAARTFQAAAVLILFLIVYAVWFLSGKAVIDTDYVAMANEIVRPVADESLNAAPFYNKAVQVYEEKSSDEISELLGRKYEEVTTEQKEAMEKWLNDNKEIFGLVLAGTDKPYYWQEYESKDGKLLSIVMPNLAGYRKLAKALRCRAHIRAEQGLYEEAFDDMMACYRFGMHLKGDNVLIEQLVGIAITGLANSTIRDILSEHQIDSGTLAELQEEFEEIADDKSFVISFKTERLLLYDELQRCFTVGDDGHIIPKRIIELSSSESEVNSYPENILDELLLLLSNVKNIRSVAYLLFLHPDRQETLESADAFYDYFEQVALKTPAQTRLDETNREEKLEELSGNMFLGVLMPALEKVIQISYRLPTEADATLTIIAVLRYKQDKGNYPESLEELITAGYLKELLLDPWSDEPLVYRKTDDDFTLYSVGFNFIDDGGQFGKDKKGNPRVWAEEGDVVFWPVAK
jgi:dsDNA-binding SOS-regulon protein